MADEMRRGRSQVIWRYTPGTTWRYNESGAWCQTTRVTQTKPQPLQGALGEVVNHTLKRWNAISPTAFPDPDVHPAKYAVGEPYQVMYSVWPFVFECRTCHRVHWYNDLSRLRSVNDRLSCMSCKGVDRLRQVPYAFVHECGRIDSISMQAHERGHTIRLVNKGTFQDSFWYCSDCRKPLYRTPREGLGFRRCQCPATRDAQGKQGGNFMRGILVEDSRIYYPQTVDMVDIEPTKLAQWRQNDRFGDLLLGAVLDVPAYEPGHVLDLVDRKPAGDELSPELKATRDALVSSGTMTLEAAEALLRGAQKQAGADPWTAYDRDLAPHRTALGATQWQNSRQTVEYVFVRDEPTSTPISLDDLIREFDGWGDQANAARLRAEKKLAGQLGIADLRVLQSLPIVLAGIGYTRYFASPRDATTGDGGRPVRPAELRPYQSTDGRIPIYAANNSTEALLFGLDPWRLAAFLQLNLGLAPPTGADEPGVRAWLLQVGARLVTENESHLVLNSFETERGLEVDEPSALSFAVLHTISHVLKATAHRYVGIDSDALTEYLFPAHAAGLLYVSSHQEFTLGGVDAVFRANLTQWLGSARDYAGRCSFDPVCSDTGGACMACLFPKFGCSHFNRTVSRAYLFGGMVDGRHDPVVGFWSVEAANAAAVLRGPSAPMGT